MAFIACEKEEDNEPDNNTPVNPINPTPTPSRPEAYVVIEADTFWVTVNRPSFDQNTFRYQFNLSSTDQLGQTGNDGNPEAYIGLVMSFKEKPTTGGQAPVSIDRFPDVGSDSVNYYFSYFVNTGSPYEGLNFLGSTAELAPFNIDNGTFTMTLPQMTLIDEGGSSTTLNLSTGYLKAENW
jgi:hypothetical protein